MLRIVRRFDPLVDAFQIKNLQIYPPPTLGTRKDQYQQTSSAFVCMVKRQPSVRDAQIRRRLPCIWFGLMPLTACIA